MYSNEELRPLLKWPGGKEKEIQYILPNIPSKFYKYYEPFVGGGSVFTGCSAETCYINDKSSELISLYRLIATENKDFHHWLYLIDTTWQSMLQYAQLQENLQHTYKHLRNKIINNAQLKLYISQYIDSQRTILLSIIPQQFNWHHTVYIQELYSNIYRKLLRMSKIEAEKGYMSDIDLQNNITTAFMSSLYMYFRYLYNDTDLSIHMPELNTALFVFIRTYAYSGMFRYNAKGQFNVPYGGMGYNKNTLTKKIAYYKSRHLVEFIQKATIENLDFEIFLRKYNPSKNDFIFLDPPYDSDFSTYAKNHFSEEDHNRLAEYLYTCDAKWLMIIKNTPLIYSLYSNKNFNIKSFDKQYAVSFMNRNQKAAEHLIITNY